MNAPHVDKMIYRIVTKDTVDYKKASAVSFENDKFRMVAGNNNEAVFEMKEHYASEQEAKSLTDEFLQKWEIIIGLENDPGDVKFRFDRAELIDLEPDKCDKGVTLSVSMSEHLVLSDHADATVSRGKYPDPQEKFSVSPNVGTMYSRYEAYHEGHDKLFSMAYLLLTVAQMYSSTRQEAADKLRIERDILDKLGDLCSTRGSEGQARKAPKDGIFVPLTAKENAWVLATCKLLIRRYGEFEYCGTEGLSPLNMDSLPPLN